MWISEICGVHNCFRLLEDGDLCVCCVRNVFSKRVSSFLSYFVQCGCLVSKYIFGLCL